MTLAHRHVTCAFHLSVGADRDTVDDIDALGSNWEPPEELEELLPGSHITVQVCQLALLNSSVACGKALLSFFFLLGVCIGSQWSTGCVFTQCFLSVQVLESGGGPNHTTNDTGFGGWTGICTP